MNAHPVLAVLPGEFADAVGRQAMRASHGSPHEIHDELIVTNNSKSKIQYYTTYLYNWYYRDFAQHGWITLQDYIC